MCMKFRKAYILINLKWYRSVCYVYILLSDIGNQIVNFFLSCWSMANLELRQVDILVPTKSRTEFWQAQTVKLVEEVCNTEITEAGNCHVQLQEISLID